MVSIIQSPVYAAATITSSWLQYLSLRSYQMTFTNCFTRQLNMLHKHTLVCLYVRTSWFKGQLVMCMRVTRGNMQIKTRKKRQIESQSSSIHPGTRVSTYGLDSTMNLDALRVQRYKRSEAWEKERKREIRFKGQWLLRLQQA